MAEFYNPEPYLDITSIQMFDFAPSFLLDTLEYYHPKSALGELPPVYPIHFRSKGKPLGNGRVLQLPTVVDKPWQILHTA